MPLNIDEFGPLLTTSEHELARPARRREDRDVLVLRIEIEAQRREVARLTAILAGGERLIQAAPKEDDAQFQGTRLLLSVRDLRAALGVTPSTLYRWIK